MEIQQKKAGNKITFTFQEDQLHYRIKDPSGMNAFTLPYEDMPTEHWEHEERRVWFRNAGLIWILLGIVGTSLQYAKDGGLEVSFWFWPGIACLLYYWFSQTLYKVYDTCKGRLFIIQNKELERIEQELFTRRAAQLKERYARVLNPTQPDNEVNRFRWLKEQGVIDENTYDELIAELQLEVAHFKAQHQEH